MRGEDMLEGIRKVAISAWYTNLMKLTPQARMGLLRNWNTEQAVKLLGEGARNVTGQKAAYKVLGNKARQMAMKTNPAKFLNPQQRQQVINAAKNETHWAGHGMKHVGDVTRNMQALTRGRVINPNMTMAHNAVTATPLQKQGVLAGLLHDTAKGSEKVLSDNVIKGNLRKYHHQFQGARNARGFFNNNKELANLAGLSGNQARGTGATNVVRAIRGHNPAGWKPFPSVKEDAYTRLGSMLRTGDDVAGNLGAVGAHRTLFNKYTQGNNLVEKGRNAWNFAFDKNRNKYRQIVADAPVHFRDYANNQRRLYYDALNRARNLNQGFMDPSLIKATKEAPTAGAFFNTFRGGAI